MDGTRLKVVVAALAVVVPAACSESEPRQTYPDASVNVDGGGVDRITTTDVPQKPAPPPGMGSRLLVKDSSALLIGNGRSACTNALPANGDRWCAFTKPSSFLGFDDLWVINASQAVAGKTIACDGSDLNCLRLTSDLFVGDLGQHGFDGDTLIFYAENRSAMGFVGVVNAWRPGWTSARPITTNTGIVCGAHPTAAVAYCFGNQDTSVANQVSYDLLAGPLNDSEESILPKIQSMIYQTAQDLRGGTRFQAFLSPDGQYIGWSARDTAMGPEILKVQKVGDVTTRKVVAEDISRWVISPDGQKWYWLKKFNYDANGNDSGTLEMAPFPDGVGPVTLLTGVGELENSGPKGIIYRAAFNKGVADLKFIGDRDNVAGTTKTLDSGVIAVWALSGDSKAVMYSKMFAGQLEQLFDLHITTTTASAPCVLVGSPQAPNVGAFSATGQTAVWARFEELSSSFHGHFTNVATCASTRYATNVLDWTAIGDEGYIYLDDATEDGFEGTLRFSQVSNGTLPAKGTVLQMRAATVIGSLLPTLPAVIYTVTLPDQTANNGIYINTTLPFTSTIKIDAGQAPEGGGPEGGGADVGGTDAAADVAAPSDAAGG